MADCRDNNRPLTEEELLELLENLSDVGDPSDGAVFEDDGWGLGEELLEIEGETDDRRVEEAQNEEPENKLTEKKVKDVPQERTKNKRRLDNSSQKEQPKRQKVEKQVSDQFEERPSANAGDFFVNNDLTKKIDIKWKKNITYLTPQKKWYQQPSDDVVELGSPLQFFSQYLVFYQIAKANHEQCVRNVMYTSVLPKK